MWTLSPQETYIVCGVVSYSLFVYAWYISHFFIQWAPARSKPLKHFSWGRRRSARFNNNNNNNNNNPGSWGSSSCDRQNPNQQHDEAITVVPLKDIPSNNNNNNDDNNNIDKSIMNSSSTNYQSITQQPVLPSHTLQDIPAAHHQSIGGGHGVVEFNLQQDQSRQHHQHY